MRISSFVVLVLVFKEENEAKQRGKRKIKMKKETKTSACFPVLPFFGIPGTNKWKKSKRRYHTTCDWVIKKEANGKMR